MKQSIYIFILSIFTSTGILSQATISGIVKTEDGEIAEGTIINVYEADTITTVDFVVVDDKGVFSIPLNTVQPLVIEAQLFGYAPQYYLVDEGATGNINSDFILYRNSFNIQEITIKDKEIGVSQKGDTLTFHIQNFTTGVERNLGDVLNRLPGIEIREGSVYYNNEKITKMLVQGRDIINSNHKLATEGIKANQIQDIQIIENYKEGADKFETERSEDVAMDVRLKESELNKWSGEVKAMGGYPSSYNGEITAFNLNDKVGLSGFARINNVAEQAVNFRDVMSLMSDMDGTRGYYVYSVTDALIPSAIWIRDDLQRNLDGAGLLSVDYRPNEKLRLRGFVMGAYVERESQVHSELTYLSNSDELTKDINSISKTPVGNTMWKLSWEPDTSIIFTFTLPFTMSTSNILDQEIGMLNKRAYDASSEDDTKTYFVNPKMSIVKHLNDGFIWNVSSGYSYSNKNGFLNLINNEAFLGAPFIEEEDVFKLSQNTDQIDQNFDFNTSIKKKWKSDFFVEPGIEYHYLTNLIQLETPQENSVLDFNADDELKQHLAATSLKIGYENDAWELVPSIVMSYLRRTLLSGQEQGEVYPTGSLSIVRKFNKAHTLRFSSTYGLDYTSFSQARNIYSISSVNSVSTGGFDLNYLTKKFSANINQNMYNPLKQLFTYIGLSYTKYFESVTSYTSLENTYEYFINKYIASPGTQSVNGYGGIGFRIAEFIRVRPNFNLNFSQGNSIASPDAILQNKNINQSYGLNIESDWDNFPLNVEISFDYSNNRQSTIDRATRNYNSYRPGAEIEFKLENFSAEVEYSYDYAQSESQVSKLNILDFEVRYQLNKIPLEFLIRAANILNVQPAQQITTNFNDQYLETRAYTIFPGYLIGGIAWSF